MASRQHFKLSPDFAKRTDLKPMTRYADGNSLYLFVAKGGTKTWVMIVTKNGRRREIGLGSVRKVSLSAARQKVADYHAAAATSDDKDVLEVKRERRNRLSMQEAALAYIDAMKSGWKHKKFEPRMRQMVHNYFGTLAERPVQSVNLEDVLKVVKPLMETKPATAKLMISFLNRVIAWSAAHKHRDPSLANPASWQGVLRFVMSKPKAGGNFAAMPYTEVPAFVQMLRDIDTVYARGCEFIILCWSRKDEVRLMRWREIDFEKCIWTAPAERMKSGRLHEIPLTKRALEILRTQLDATGAQSLADVADQFVFPSPRTGEAISETTMNRLIPRPYTLHGFRSSARSWAGDCTNHAREVAELALSHKLGNAVEQAYYRTTALERRGALLRDWSIYLSA